MKQLYAFSLECFSQSNHLLKARYSHLRPARNFLLVPFLLLLLSVSSIAQPFITTWQTTADGQTITIPTTGSGYSYIVDWGDGSTDATVYTGDAPHPYATLGTYTVSVTGNFPRIFFNGTGDKDKIQTIEQWGDNAWTSMAGAFRSCNNLTYNATDIPDLSGVTDLSHMFESTESFNGNIDGWDVSTITNMKSTFQAASAFNQNIGSWDVSSVANMTSLFEGSDYNQDLSNWDVGSVSNMFEMFAESDFNQDISNWDVSSVTNMSSMFVFSAFNQDISNWDVSSVTHMFGMFGNTNFNQDIGGWDVSGVTDMSFMFVGTSVFNQDIGNWNVSSVLDMNSMFEEAVDFNQDIGNWDVSAVTNMSSMFDEAMAFDQNLGNWDISAVTTMSRMFSGGDLLAAMSTANYDNTLTGWSTLGTGESMIPIGISLTADLMYCNATAARDELINTYNWSITGDSNNCPPVPDLASLADLSDCNTITPGVPIAIDPIDGQINGTTITAFPITTLGTTDVVWTYTNLAGNKVTQTQIVFIGDISNPVPFDATLGDVTSDCPLETLTAPTATDNCSGTITGTPDATFPITAQGTTVVTWTFDDGNGNTAAQTQNVVIDDTTAPVADVTTLADVTSECSATPTAPIATDNCVGQITGAPDATFPITTQGTTVVTWTFDDGNGNTTTQTQNVVIDCITAIEDDLYENLKIYPNPTVDFLIIESKEPILIRLFDLHGKLIKQDLFSYGKLDLRNITQGVYLLEISSDDHKLQQRIVKTN